MRRDSGAQYLFINSKFNTHDVSAPESTSVCFISTVMDFCYF